MAEEIFLCQDEDYKNQIIEAAKKENLSPITFFGKFLLERHEIENKEKEEAETFFNKCSDLFQNELMIKAHNAKMPIIEFINQIIKEAKSLGQK